MATAKITKSEVDREEGIEEGGDDTDTELPEDFSALSLDEQEKSIALDIARLEQQERVAKLIRKRQTLIMRQKKRSETPKRTLERTTAQDELPQGDIPVREQLEIPLEDDHVASAEAQGHSTFGMERARTRSRHSQDRRRRRHRCSRSSSGSGSRSSSSTRRRRRKWSIKRYIVGSKTLKKLNAYELIESSARWILDIPRLTTVDYRAFIQHVSFLCNRAKSDEFKDTAHTEYDKDIRTLAETIGFAAFGKAHTSESILYYGSTTTYAKKTHYPKETTYVKRGPTRKRPCFRFNREGGCDLTEEKCGFGHLCGKCFSKSHGRHNCVKN